MSERMRWSEAESVVRAYRAERGASADVDVTSLADALGVDVAEIRRLAGRRRRFTDRSGVLSAGLAMAFACGAALFFGAHASYRRTIVAQPTSRTSASLYRPLNAPRIEMRDGTGWVQIDGKEKIALGNQSEGESGRLSFHEDEPL